MFNGIIEQCNCIMIVVIIKATNFVGIRTLSYIMTLHGLKHYVRGFIVLTIKIKGVF